MKKAFAEQSDFFFVVHVLCSLSAHSVSQFKQPIFPM